MFTSICLPICEHPSDNEWYLQIYLLNETTSIGSVVPSVKRSVSHCVPPTPVSAPGAAANPARRAVRTLSFMSKFARSRQSDSSMALSPSHTGSSRLRSFDIFFENIVYSYSYSMRDNGSWHDSSFMRFVDVRNDSLRGFFAKSFCSALYCLHAPATSPTASWTFAAAICAWT